MARGRAERRYRKEVLKRRVERIARDCWGDGWNGTVRREANWSAKLADHPNECHHTTCQSPRKWAKGDAKLSIRERRNRGKSEG